MLFTIVIVTFGLLFGRRIFLHMDQNKILDNKDSTMTWFLFVGVQIGLYLVLFSKPHVLWLAELSTFFIPVVVYAWQRLSRRRHFKIQLVPMLDYLIMQMRSGLTLKEAIVLAPKAFPSINFIVAELESLLQFETEITVSMHDRQFIEVAEELCQIHQTPFKACDRLKSYRNKIKIEQDFRQKTGQVTLQIRAQAMILSFLYLGLCVHSLSTYSWPVMQTFFVSSLFIFILGIFVLLTVPGRFKWKI